MVASCGPGIVVILLVVILIVVTTCDFKNLFSKSVALQLAAI